MADTTGRVYGSTANNGSNILYGTTTYGDAYAPNVVVSSTSIVDDGYINTNVPPQNFVITFSEIDITNFTNSDITVTNGVKTNFAGPTTVGGVDVFTVDIAPFANGLVSVSVGAGVANDFAGNPNNASNTYTFTFDGVPPTVANVTSSTSDGYYNISDVISIQVVFSEIVVVAGGTPQLTLETGGTDAVVNYSSGSGTNTLTFNYTVASGHTSSDLDYQSTSALALNGATIKDLAGNDATLTLASPGAAGSLGANKAIVIDTTSPTVVITSPTVLSGGSTSTNPILFTATFSEPVSTFTLADVTVSSGTKQNLAGSGAVYTFELASPTLGLVTVDIGSAVVTDTAGNNNTAATQFTFTATASGGEVSGSISGTRTTETWIGEITFTGNIIIPSGVTVTVDLNAVIYANGYVIVVQDGGVLNTQNKRLPRNSSISAVMVIT
jgi:methionine-rich copper-binding protein CopC